MKQQIPPSRSLPPRQQQQPGKLAAAVAEKDEGELQRGRRIKRGAIWRFQLLCPRCQTPKDEWWPLDRPPEYLKCMDCGMSSPRLAWDLYTAIPLEIARDRVRGIIVLGGNS